MSVDNTIIPIPRLAVGDKVVLVGEQQRDGLGIITEITPIVSYRYAVRWDEEDADATYEPDVFEDYQLVGPLRV